MKKAPCAVVCVTQQASCKRLIEAGKRISDEHGLRLEVLNVQPVKDCYSRTPGPWSSCTSHAAEPAPG